MATVDDETKAQFYSASLGFYKSFLRECFQTAEGMVNVRSSPPASSASSNR